MNNEKRVLVSGQIYKHFKGNLYQIVTAAIHSETGEKLVIYQKLYGDFKVHARPYDMFMSEVDHVKYPDVKQKYRFELVTMSGDNVSELQADEIKEPEFNTFEQLEKAVSNQKEGVSDSSNQNMNMDFSNTGLQEGIHEDFQIDARLIGFLDAESFEEKRKYLLELRENITDRLIDDMATSIDVIIDEGDINTRFTSLLNCISTRAKYEVIRR